MTIPEIAEQVQSAVRVGTALKKPEKEIRDDVRALVGHLSFGELDQLHDHIAAADNAHTFGTAV